MKKTVMKNIEPAYFFRHELDEVHKRNRRNFELKPRENETSVDESWSIVLPENADHLIEYAATDLQDYFRISMNQNLPLSQRKKEHSIVLDLCHCQNDSTCMVQDPPKKSFRFEVMENQIRITGSDPASVAQGCYQLEDRMNLREAVESYLKYDLVQLGTVI